MNKSYVILSDNKTAIIRKKIEEELYKTFKSGWSTYWFPLKDIKDNIPVIAFNSDYWDDDYKMQSLLNLMKCHNIKKVYTLQENSNVYVYDDYLSEVGLLEQDEDMLSYNFPYYSEQYTWDGSHDWLIYTSHEATVTFAGEWLVKAIKDEFQIDEIDIISKNKCCSNCGEVTGHFKYMRNIVYECPSCKTLFYFK
ncbi:hypothetical protein [Clostridium sp. YIM B02569]|uniref:hypothetical protein n=1 Tax=Clostridium sp. YIM B02569 TaxID=2911967 RepID=UPI001EEA9DE8|nr:hypothetical protein [Clostridium sp. YIM B02569]